MVNLEPMHMVFRQFENLNNEQNYICICIAFTTFDRVKMCGLFM